MTLVRSDNKRFFRCCCHRIVLKEQLAIFRMKILKKFASDAKLLEIFLKKYYFITVTLEKIVTITCYLLLKKNFKITRYRYLLL